MWNNRPVPIPFLPSGETLPAHNHHTEARMATTQISVEEYLRTSPDPDCEYVHGVIKERAVPERIMLTVANIRNSGVPGVASKTRVSANPACHHRQI
jgi:hypothetical protein